jgi:large subunit ribosomal protein L15
MYKLSELTKISKKRKRVGRGGERGGTSGRGHKGQNARSGGGVRRGFEGGQMPLSRRLPQRGFNNTRFAIQTSIVSLEVLDQRFDDGAQITKDLLVEKGLVEKRARRIKILGGYELTKKFSIEAHAFSASAVEALKKVGGEALVIEG